MLVSELTAFLTSFFNTVRYPPDEQGGVYERPNAAASDRPLHRLGLALEPGPDLPAWLHENRIDALWLHRPWQLDPSVLPPDFPVLFHHLPFDEHLTIGYNHPLADALGMSWTATRIPEVLGTKQAPGFPVRPIGMIGPVVELDFTGWCHRIAEQFGGYDEAKAGHQNRPERIAVVGAMNDALVREAAARGAGLYVTGQYRKSAQKAVDETGMAVLAVGHRRSEEWGLRMLAEILRNHGFVALVTP
ncbi:Nif3-like dinuclear metal center hexameric protein [Larkinella insperata]|uniref:Nif3-like dinuclear metal center hexameric protein n=1 Tax=Larkinella insperata TaxID=332158 RepID=A0ABW3QF92_9BACT|nr:Nif3-like dinuclear metal center hexameric protein [Larkinella insperata]